MNLNYLRPWKEEFDRTERFLTSCVVIVVAAYTAWTAWDMRNTLQERGCEVFVKEFGGVADNASLRFYSKEELRNRTDGELNQKMPSNFSFEQDFNYSSTNIR